MSQKATKPEAFKPGEIIEFDDLIIKTVDTKFGPGRLVTFVDKDMTVLRKSFAGGLAEFLERRPDAKAVMLKGVVEDGEYSQNLWAVPNNK